MAKCTVWRKLYKVIVVAGAVLSVRKLIDVIYRKWNNYPPGCIGIPIFGFYFFSSNYKYISSLTNSYGSVFMIYVGWRPLLLINDLKICKELFNSSSGAKRGDDYCVMGEKKRSLTESYGKSLIMRRKLLHESFVTILDCNYLNNIGINILEQNLFYVFDQAISNKKSLQLRFHVKYAVFTLIFTTIFGSYVDLPDKYSYIYEKLYFGMEKSLNNFGKYQNEMMMYPQIQTIWRYFLDKLVRFEIIQGMNMLEDVINVFVTQLLSNKNVKEDIYIKPTLDAFKSGKLTPESLKSDVQSIFVAGMHTTSLIFTECCVMCAKHQNIQQLVYQELVKYEKKYAKFELKHYLEFPLLRALVHEMLRWGFVDVLSGVPRVIRDENVTIGSYNIPKETIVYGFYAKFMHSKDKWNNPSKFDLNNFLDHNGKFKSNPAFSTFGIGKRNCPGSQLAKREICLLLGRTLLKYKLNLDQQFPDHIPIDIDSNDPDSELHAKLLDTHVIFAHR